MPIFEDYQENALQKLGISVHDGMVSTLSQSIRLRDISRLEEVRKETPLIGFVITQRLVAHCTSGRVVLFEASSLAILGGDRSSISHWITVAREAIELAMVSPT